MNLSDNPPLSICYSVCRDMKGCDFLGQKKKILCLGLQRGKKLGRSVGDNFFFFYKFYHIYRAEADKY